MKKLILVIIILMICGIANADYGKIDGAVLLYNYFYDFMNENALGTSRYGRIDGQVEYQNLFIQFLEWADTASVNVSGDTTKTDFLSAKDSTEIELLDDFFINSFETTTNPGEVTVFNAPVDSTSADSTEHSLGFAIDGNTVLKVKGSSDGNGGVDELQTVNLGDIRGLEKSSDPVEPDEGEFVIWMSDGSGKGDDGDIMIGSNPDGTTKYGTLFDHSSGSNW